METLVKLKEVAEQVVLDRRHLHAHPELGFQEHETAKFVAERLRGLGLEVQTGIAETGVPAAQPPVAIVSASSVPGSRKWTCISKKPGAIISPVASKTETSAAVALPID